MTPRKPRPGDIVRHKGTGYYPGLGGHYGLVQEARVTLGVEWDTDTPHGHSTGHDLGDVLLPPPRDLSGWYVAPEDVEVV